MGTLLFDGPKEDWTIQRRATKLITSFDNRDYDIDANDLFILS